MPAQQGQRRQHDKGNNASATLTKTPAQCWWQQGCNKGNITNIPMAKVQALQGQRCQQNDGKDASATMAKKPMLALTNQQQSQEWQW